MKYTKAPEGYFKQNLGFTSECETCGTRTKVLGFTHVVQVAKMDPGYDGRIFAFPRTQTCSFECFKKTAEYLGPNPPMDAVRA